jgi:hypothetical protein
MIIVRSEKAFNRPPTSIGSNPSTMVAAPPIAIGSYHGKQDGKLYGLHSMGMKTESDEQV